MPAMSASPARRASRRHHRGCWQDGCAIRLVRAPSHGRLRSQPPQLL